MRVTRLSTASGERGRAIRRYELHEQSTSQIEDNYVPFPR